MLHGSCWPGPIIALPKPPALFWRSEVVHLPPDGYADRLAKYSPVMASSSGRALPNILITGTPGTGKSTMAQMLQSQASTLRHIEVGALVKDKQLYTSWDEELETYEMDEERVLDELEELLEPGGAIVDFHGAELFPERWFDLVLVLRTDNGVLYPRLQSRCYSEKKLAENMEAEIMQVILDEAREAYQEEIVIELRSDTVEDIESNVQRVVQWMQQWSVSRAAK